MKVWKRRVLGRVNKMDGLKGDAEKFSTTYVRISTTYAQFLTTYALVSLYGKNDLERIDNFGASKTRETCS